MPTPADNSVIHKLLMPTAVNGDTSPAFTIPNGAKVLTLHMPAMVSDATVKIQKLYPAEGDRDTEVWADLSAAIIANPMAFSAIAGIPESAATTIPVAALGGGVLRLVASAAQTGAIGAITVWLSWGMDG